MRHIKVVTVHGTPSLDETRKGTANLFHLLVEDSEKQNLMGALLMPDKPTHVYKIKPKLHQTSSVNMPYKPLDLGYI